MGVSATFLVALLPLWVARIVLDGWEALRTAVLCVAVALAADIAGKKLRGKPVRLRELSPVTLGLLIAWLIPQGTPWWVSVAAGAAGMVIGREIFGGFAQNVFHPALVAHVGLTAAFPARLAGSWWPAADALSSFLYLAAALLGGLVILFRGAVSWKIPCCHIGTMAFLASVSGQDPLGELLASGALVAGFFYVTDYATSPLTQSGRILFATAAGGAAWFLRSVCGNPHGESYAILLLNAAAPLADFYVQKNRWVAERVL